MLINCKCHGQENNFNITPFYPLLLTDCFWVETLPFDSWFWKENTGKLWLFDFLTCLVMTMYLE